MVISATLSNIYRENDVSVSTGEHKKKIIIPSKPLGKGSSVNGGELLMLAIAACYCNDIYREAERSDIDISSVEVTVRGEFAAEGAPATNITYEVKVESTNASVEEISDLISYVDTVAEVHNTLRTGINVTLKLQESKPFVEARKLA